MTSMRNISSIPASAQEDHKTTTEHALFELKDIRHRFQLLRRDRHPLVLDQRSKPLPRMILTSDLGVVRKHRREHTALEVLGGQVRSARAEAAVSVQREAAAVIQDSELAHVDVHACLVSARKLRPRAEDNDRDAHEVNDNACPGTPGGLPDQGACGEDGSTGANSRSRIGRSRAGPRSESQRRPSPCGVPPTR